MTIDQLKSAIRKASNTGDVQAMEKYATELEEIGTDETLAAAAQARGIADVTRGNYHDALEHYHRALGLFEHIGNKRGVASVTTNMGNVTYNVGDLAKALEYYLRSVELYIEAGIVQGSVKALHGIGNVHCATSDYPKALEYYQRALLLSEEAADRDSMARLSGSLGNVYYSTGDYPKALEYAHRALTLFEDDDNTSGVAQATLCIGSVYTSTENYEQAMECYQRAVAILEQRGDVRAVSVAYENIGRIYFALGNTSSALEHYRRSLALSEQTGNRQNATLVNSHILEVFTRTESFDEAETLLEKMDALQIDNPIAVIHREKSRARIQEHYGHLDDAMQTLLAALTIAQDLKLQLLAAQLHLQLRDLCRTRGDFDGYIEHNNENARIAKEVNGKETATKLAMQEAERTIAKEREQERTERERIAKEREREQAVLYSTLPKHIADRVIRGEQVNDHIDNASVLFLDVVGFTTLSSGLTSHQISSLLDTLFGICDAACTNQQATRIKTIGDSYLSMAIDH